MVFVQLICGPTRTEIIYSKTKALHILFFFGPLDQYTQENEPLPNFMELLLRGPVFGNELIPLRQEAAGAVHPDGVVAGNGHVSVPHPVGRRELEVAPDVARLLRGPHASDQVLPLGRQRAAHQPRTITQVVVQSTSVTVAQITSN